MSERIRSSQEKLRAANTQLELAERLRVTVAAHAFPGEGQTPVTISVGLSSYERGDTRDAMIERADEVLYRAKAQGRNRVGN